eukprot:TRINITY_DN14651_c0_g1_i1.p1 TRINITY_DN14651_c0_g1~~TRINITY_DN14651_c0_g1_i1.p1  ORF type:complete len:1018 (+),score=161.55 TRINITY_DN14651_c0_g1_i1:115-3168(+)
MVTVSASLVLSCALLCSRAPSAAALRSGTGDRLASLASDDTPPDVQSGCLTAQPGGALSKCYRSIFRAMQANPLRYPALYDGLSPEATFEDFQAYYYSTERQDKSGCTSAPCPVLVATTTTTSTTPPPGTPACPERSPLPPLPAQATSYNGISWPEYCFTGLEDEHVFIIGDWGGLTNQYTRGPADVIPAPNTAHRDFSWPVDRIAQRLVARQLNRRARLTNPRYVLNAGDNFYWGGIREKCSRRKFGTFGTTNQWSPVFEEMYKGPGIDGKPWFSVLGNHDYGGYQFSSAWDQQVAYTWGPSGRWVLPGQYWHQRVDYPTKNFTVDYYMMDSNVNDARHPYHDPEHNICSLQFNHDTCAPVGPRDAWDCKAWFERLWREQLAWLEVKLQESTADWQIIVTHFPPEPVYRERYWRELVDKYGVDFFVTAHRHQQEAHKWSGAHAPYVVVGGGGGVTSERSPVEWGGLDQYGFMDMRISKTTAMVEAFDHRGDLRRRMVFHPRLGSYQLEKQRREQEQLRGPADVGVDLPVAAASWMAPLSSLDYSAAKSVDGGNNKSDEEIYPLWTCDGMGPLVDDSIDDRSGCGSSFDGAQVEGILMLSSVNASALARFPGFVAVVAKAIAVIGNIEEPRDVTVVFTSAVPRSVDPNVFAVNFSIEVPADDLVAVVGDVLRGKSLAEIDIAISRCLSEGVALHGDHVGSVTAINLSVIERHIKPLKSEKFWQQWGQQHERHGQQRPMLNDSTNALVNSHARVRSANITSDASLPSLFKMALLQMVAIFSCVILFILLAFVGAAWASARHDRDEAMLPLTTSNRSDRNGNSEHPWRQWFVAVAADEHFGSETEADSGDSDGMEEQFSPPAPPRARCYEWGHFGFFLPASSSGAGSIDGSPRSQIQLEQDNTSPASSTDSSLVIVPHLVSLLVPPTDTRKAVETVAVEHGQTDEEDRRNAGNAQRLTPAVELASENVSLPSGRDGAAASRSADLEGTVARPVALSAHRPLWMHHPSDVSTSVAMHGPQ